MELSYIREAQSTFRYWKSTNRCNPLHLKAEKAICSLLMSGSYHINPLLPLKVILIARNLLVSQLALLEGHSIKIDVSFRLCFRASTLNFYYLFRRTGCLLHHATTSSQLSSEKYIIYLMRTYI